MKASFLYQALRWAQLAGAALLFGYLSWQLCTGHHIGDVGLGGLFTLAVIGFVAEAVRRNAGLEFTWTGVPK